MFRLDRTHFTARNIREQHLQRGYWLEKTPDERLAAAAYLIAQAWGYDPARPPRMDRTFFLMRKHDACPE